MKQQGRGVDQPFPSSTEVKERVELYLYSPSGSSWSVLGRTLTISYITLKLIFGPVAKGTALAYECVFYRHRVQFTTGPVPLAARSKA